MTVDQKTLRRLYWKITGLIMLAMIGALAGISYFTQRAFEASIVPEMAHKAVTVGVSVRTLIARATSYGIDYRALYGVDQTLAEVREDNPEYAYLAATDADGRILFESGHRPAGAADHFSAAPMLERMQAGQPTAAALVGGQYLVGIPLQIDERVAGMLHIGIEQRYVQKIMLEVLLDVVVVLLVALFFTLEMLNFMAGAQLEVALVSLGSAIERLHAGNLAPVRTVPVGGDIGRLLARLEAGISGLGQRYRRLGQRLEEQLARADEAGRQALQPAVAAMNRLHLTTRFTAETGTAELADNTTLNRIRAPFFAFILAEELTRSFLPSYANELLVPIPWLSPKVVIGLPIALFMLVVALGQPALGLWSERVGRRRAMLVGAALGAVGFALTAMAQSLYDLLLWRSLCAVGYGMVFVAAQGYVLDHSHERNRTQGFALFVGAIMVATICGPPLGGILADNLGNRIAFAVSAVLAALSMIVIRGLPDTVLAKSERQPTWRDFRQLLGNGRFMLLTGLAAIPAKIILTGFCFYLVPLYIVSIGSNQAMAGRMLMVYAVVMVLIVPIAARVADQRARREQLVAVGLCLSGVGGLLMLFADGFAAVVAMVFLLGLGQALSIAAQGTLVSELCSDQVKSLGAGPVFGVYRLLERLGNVAGPILASILLVVYDYRGAFIGISALVLASGLVFGALTGAWKAAPRLAGESP